MNSSHNPAYFITIPRALLFEHNDGFIENPKLLFLVLFSLFYLILFKMSLEYYEIDCLVSLIPKYKRITLRHLHANIP